MLELNNEKYYSSKIHSLTRNNCAICEYPYMSTFTMKNVEDDTDVVDSEGIELHVCRKCLQQHDISTKTKTKCSECNTFYKMKCTTCTNDEKDKNKLINKTRLVISKLTNKRIIKELKDELSKL